MCVCLLLNEIRCLLTLEFLTYWGLSVCMSGLNEILFPLTLEFSQLQTALKKHLLQTACNYIFLIIITLNLSNICCIQQSHLYIYLHGHYNSESFQYMLYTIYKKIELHNYINNGYIEDGVSPHFFNLPPSLILLILKILRWFLFKL